MPHDVPHLILAGIDAFIALLYVCLFAFARTRWSIVEQLFMIFLPLAASALLLFRLVPIPGYNVVSYYLTQFVGVGIPVFLYGLKSVDPIP